MYITKFRINNNNNTNHVGGGCGECGWENGEFVKSVSRVGDSSMRKNRTSDGIVTLTGVVGSNGDAVDWHVHFQ